MHRIPLLLLLVIFPLSVLMAGPSRDENPPAGRFTVNGHIKDAADGEVLIGATVYVEEAEAGTVSNTYGFYSISLKPGRYTFRFSYVGYATVYKAVELSQDITLNVELRSSEKMLEEVVIIDQREDENVRKPEMSVVKMDARMIHRIPALMGEVDIIKAIQLLPGVQSTSEGSSGFSVRGGSPDQNLILLDEATVYNPSHLLGFFSVFNNDAVKDVELFKGDIPAQYGGRLSSVLDVRMKDGNNKNFSMTGGIGLISSRLTMEGPVVKDKGSFIVSGRRTYADVFLPLSGNEDVRDNRLYFYDLNAKVNHSISEKDRIYASAYFGRDIFYNPYARMHLGNATTTLRWNHVFPDRLFSNFTLIYSKYNYSLGTAEEDAANSFVWESFLEDAGVKGDLTYYLNKDNTLRFGISSLYHTFDPGKARGTSEESLFTEYAVPRTHALESGFYVSNEQKAGRLTVKYGLRFSLFQNMGESTVFHFDEEYVAVDSVNYGKGVIYNSYSGIEPRVGVTWLLNESSSVKASYSRTNQYLQLAQNSTAGTPLDVWFPASPNVMPQVADQFAIGYFRNFSDNRLETSVELYYKAMKNAIDFKDHAQLLLNRYLEGELRVGTASSYGAELLLRVPRGRLNGWISYTFSRTIREIPEINDGNAYPAPYDVPHDIAIVLNYEFNSRWLFSANWIYSTGKPVTFPTGRAVIDGVVLPIYSDRNAYRLQDYHRLDLAATLRQKPRDDRDFKWELVFAAYNAYNRHNTWAINFIQDEDDPLTTYAEKTYLFGIVPSVTFNFKFR